MSIVSTITNKIAGKSKDARGCYADCVHAEAAGKGTPKHAEGLQSSLAVLGKSLEDFEADVLLVQRRDRLAKAANIDSIGGKLGKARGEVRAHQAETKRITEQRAAECAKLRRKANEIAGQLSRAEKALRELCEVEGDRPDLFGGKDIDLDRVTLRHGADIIPIYDTEAPTVNVNRATFDREHHRRLGILKQAQVEARDEYDRAVVETAKKRNTFMGSVAEALKAIPEPQRRAVSWRDIVESGDIGRIEKAIANNTK